MLHASRAEKWRGVTFLLLLLAFFVSAEFLSYRLFKSFLYVGDVTFQFLALLLTIRLLGLLFLIVMALLFFGAMIASIDALYFDDDIDFLASHPIRRSSILIKKFISIYSTSAWVVFLIVTPVMVAYGRAIGGSFTHLPLSLFALFIFTLAPVALAAAAVILLMRMMPIDRAREAVLAFGALLSFGIVYLYRLLSPAQLFRVDKLVADAQGFIRDFTLPGFDSLPSNIMAKSLIASASLKFEPYAMELSALLGITIVSLAIYLGVGALFFETDRPVSGSAARPGAFERVMRLAALSRRISLLAPSGSRGLLYKEIMTNLRDPMQISHLVLMIAIVVLHFANLREIPFGIHPGARVLIAFLNLGLVGFLMAGVAVRFIYPSISLEGHPFWLIESAPISKNRFLTLKFFAGWIPLTAVSLAVVVVSNAIIGVGAALMFLWVVATLALGTVITAFGIAIGVTMPVFNKKNVFEISSSPGGIIFMLVSLLYVGSTVAVLVSPTYAAAFEGGALSTRALAAITVICASATLLTAVAWRIAANGIENFEERKYATS